MFPELEARETPSVELAATTADGRAMEAATGIVPEWFVESALGRCRVVFTTEEEYRALTDSFATRLAHKFVNEPDFAAWVQAQADPRPVLCALIYRWTREPAVGLTCEPAVCAQCNLRAICPNTGFNHKEASDGHTFKVVVPCPGKAAGSTKLLSYPCSDEPLYDFAGAKKVIDSFTKRRPNRSPEFAVWAFGRTQKFDAGCLKFGIADPNGD